LPARLADRKKDALPASIYWDTSFALDAILKPSTSSPWKIRVRHQEAVELVKRLEAARCRVYYSSLLFVEFWDVILKIELRAKYGDEYGEKLEADPTIVGEHARRVNDAGVKLNDLLARFPSRFQVNPTKDVYAKALALMLQYPLRSSDALHISSGLHAGVLDFAASDKHFEQVDRIVIWRNW
jgi:predicted nucleic acid-binding protein